MKPTDYPIPDSMLDYLDNFEFDFGADFPAPPRPTPEQLAELAAAQAKARRRSSTDKATSKPVAEPAPEPIPAPRFSDYVVYVDESGDHGWQTVNPDYPLFVLAFCVFAQHDYIHRVVPRLQAFKFKHFGHDAVVLHEQDIRKEKGACAIFRSKTEKAEFVSELANVIHGSPFRLISSVINKAQLPAPETDSKSPYQMALAMGLEQIYKLLHEQNQTQSITHVLFKTRGKKEDDLLELEFRRICDGDNWFKQRLPLQAKFVDPHSNAAGLQLADLIARPIGVHLRDPEQANPTFAAIQDKLYVAPSDQRPLDSGLAYLSRPAS